MLLTAFSACFGVSLIDRVELRRDFVPALVTDELEEKVARPSSSMPADASIVEIVSISFDMIQFFSINS